jgi:hypothetical protein
MRAIVLLCLLMLAGCGGGRTGASVGTSSSLECAVYARQVTGIRLYGDASSWWDQAESRYRRSITPVAGGVLVFQRSGRLPSGHVSVVSRQVSSREIRVAQANWVRHRITRDEPVLDVSPGNDWSQVRVWWAPTGSLGTTTYATYGFIAPEADGAVAEAPEMAPESE